MFIFSFLFLALTLCSPLFSQELRGEHVRIWEEKANYPQKRLGFLQPEDIPGRIPATFSLKRALLGDQQAFLPEMKMEARLHRAFFCRIEDIREEKAGMGLKFRLGTVPYVDRLEGKTTIIPPDY